MKMDGVIHRGQWLKKANHGSILLLVYMFIPTLTLLQPPEGVTCPYGDYLSGNGICCNKCSPGFKLLEECQAPGQRSNCTRCPSGQYTDTINYTPNCRSCKRCRKKHDVQVEGCQKHKDTICRCAKGYYKYEIDSATYECLKCQDCGSNEKERLKCTPEKDTECECKQNFYRVNNRCEPCTNCTVSPECEYHCSSLTTLNTKAPGIVNEYNITGVTTAVLVLIVLVVVITYLVTKWFTKKKLLKSSPNSSEVSPEPCEEIFIHDEEPSYNVSIKGVPVNPVNEHEQLSKLPDCVPLEIKIPDVIYMVLDLVPVQQVKQLVRSLGVKDTAIEQAELDYRSCREAHYQMLRVWAERGSQAGGMLHSSLLQDLLNELRRMHLERAAEELETNYDFM